MDTRKDDRVQGERNMDNTGKGWEGGTENQSAESKPSSATPGSGTTQPASNIPPSGGTETQAGTLEE